MSAKVTALFLPIRVLVLPYIPVPALPHALPVTRSKVQQALILELAGYFPGPVVLTAEAMKPRPAVLPCIPMLPPSHTFALMSRMGGMLMLMTLVVIIFLLQIWLLMALSTKETAALMIH
jgi:hypothetical protein